MNHFECRLRFVLSLLIPCLSACVDTLVLPTPPDVSERAERYVSPTATLDSTNAAEFVQGFIGDRARLAEVNDFRDVTNLLLEFDAEVAVSSDGEGSTVSILGAPIQTDARIDLTGDCPGWNDSTSENAVNLTVVVRKSELIPTAWGEISDCRLERVVNGESLKVRVDAELVTYLPNLLAEDKQSLIAYVAYDILALSVGDQTLALWSGDFRINDTTLEFLIQISIGSVVAFSREGLTEIGIRAANGEWTCLPEERRCESLQLPSFSY